ncbi:MAG: VWA domain-containing protein [Gammaproteobacteria bacterium]
MKTSTLLASTEKDLWRALKKQYSVIEDKDVAEQIQDRLDEWESKISRTLEIENPYWDDFSHLEKSEEDFHKGNASVQAIEEDISNYKNLIQKTDSVFDDFWNDKLANLRKSHSLLPEKNRKDTKIAKAKEQKQKQLNEQAGLRGSLQKQWRKEAETAYAEWELQQINDYRQKILEQLTSWLDLLQELFSFFSQLSLEPGLLFDLSDGSLTATDIEILKRWMTYISQNKGAKALCDMLGRLRQAEQSGKEELIKYTENIKIEIPNTNSVEEIIGITLGKDLENTIPEELALLADDDSALLFDLKFIENRLMCFDTQGLQEVDMETDAEKKAEVVDDEKMGPIIICVDTSGSMQGSPETIAKAVTLYMATRAASQNRNCYLINFSTAIETLDLSHKMGLKETISFLQRSFRGGTDVAPALEHALATLKHGDYKQADILTISDFVMGNIPEDLYAKIVAAKESKNKFYSLCIGEHFMNEKLQTIFDKEWVYSPSNSNIKEVHKFMQAVA